MYDLAIIIPCFNEVETLQAVVEKCIVEVENLQIIIVDDGSLDGSDAIIRQLDHQHSFVSALTHPSSRGKGVAIRSAMPLVQARFVVIQDADLEYSPRDICGMLEKIRGARQTVVYGSRYLAASYDRRFLAYGVHFLTRIANRLYSIQLTDIMTCYKMFPAEIIPLLDLNCSRFEFCTEITSKICRLGYHIEEVAISYSPRNNHEGKKIRWTAGFSCLHSLIKYRKWQPG